MILADAITMNNLRDLQSNSMDRILMKRAGGIGKGDRSVLPYVYCHCQHYADLEHELIDKGQEGHRTKSHCVGSLRSISAAAHLFKILSQSLEMEKLVKQNGHKFENGKVGLQTC